MKAFFAGRRKALLFPLGLAGCFSTSAGTCDTPLLGLTDSGLGNGNFDYVCPSPGGPDAWCDLNESIGVTGDVPTVAVGASFSIAYTDNTYSNIVPVPAVPSFTTPAGTSAPPTGDATAPGSTPVALSAPGAYAFLADEPGSSPPVLRDFINVQAGAVATLSVAPSIDTLYLTASPVTVYVSPLASDGTTLAGEFTCTVASSDPSTVTATATGRGAIVTAYAVGKSVLTLSCLGVTTKVTTHVLAASDDGGDDAGPDAATKDAAGGDAANDDAGDAGTPPGDDAASDAADDAEPDATASDADADGGE